jgi:hypothetical protein
VPGSGATELVPGKGLIWYSFASSGMIPGVFGHEPTADVTVPLHADGNRWNLLGNPYTKPISVSALQGDGDFVPVAQVWQDATGESLGSWILSSDPALGGVIAPWQAFMLQNGAENAASQLTIPLTAKTSGGAGFFRETQDPAVRIPIEVVRMEGGRGLRHDRGPMIEFDTRPAVVVQRLTPLDGSAAYGWFTGFGTQKNAVATIHPETETEASVAYEVSLPGNGVWRIRWNDIPRLPDGWTLRFYDLVSGVEVDVMEDDGYGFIHSDGEQVLEGRFVFIARKAESTDIEPEPRRESPQLLSAWPNPFNPVTVVGYRLSVVGDVRLSVHDILGREVAVLANGIQQAGSHQVRFDATNLASGVYFVRLHTQESTTLQLITLIK